jgi:hypothetical protein
VGGCHGEFEARIRSLDFAARCLHRSGQWDTALAVLDDDDLLDDAGEGEGRRFGPLRAEILVDRCFWTLDDPSSARAAVDLLDPTTSMGQYLRAQLAYQRILFDRGRLAADQETAESGFRAAVGDDVLHGWAIFYLGVVADNVNVDPGTALRAYDAALDAALRQGDLLLESYVLRHLAAHTIEQDSSRGVHLLRRSLHLRSALGARPQVAAAMAALADALPIGPEQDTLRDAAHAVASELGLTWVMYTLSQAD